MHVACTATPARHGRFTLHLAMPSSYRASRKARDDRCWCRQAVMTAAAMGCLLQPSSSFLTHHVVFHRHNRVLSSSSATTTAMSAAPQPQQSTAAEAVRPVSLESLVTETNPREPVRSLVDAKQQILERVGYGSQSPGAERPQSEEERVGYLLEVLEGNYKPILTVGFFNFAAQVRTSFSVIIPARVPLEPVPRTMTHAPS